MKYDIDFTCLSNLANSLDVIVDSSIIIDLASEETIAELSNGIEIDSNSIDWSKECFVCHDQVVFLHIKDNRSTSIFDLRFPEKLKRYHFWNCSTLSDMRAKGKEDKYVFSKSIDPVFLVDTKNKTNDKRKLQACWNCIQQSGIQKTIDNRFPSHEQILLFMKNKEVDIKRKARSQYLANTGYTNNWKELSYELRKNNNWTCSNCKVHLTQKYSFCLDVHHINGIKSDNTSSNLKVLCKICHSDQPGHEHMKLEKDWNQCHSIIMQKRS
jgi:hypothetical protein